VTGFEFDYLPLSSMLNLRDCSLGQASAVVDLFKRVNCDEQFNPVWRWIGQLPGQGGRKEDRHIKTPGARRLESVARLWQLPGR
jgi:hypothetical protein